MTSDEHFTKTLHALMQWQQWDDEHVGNLVGAKKRNVSYWRCGLRHPSRQKQVEVIRQLGSLCRRMED